MGGARRNADLDRGGRKPERRAAILLTRLSGAWEGLWRALWRPAAVIGAFLIFALLEIPSVLSGLVHAIALGLFAGFAGWFAYSAVKRLSIPGEGWARRRLETEAGLDHRPLSTTVDRQATGLVDPQARMLWQLHLDRERRRAESVRPRWPTPRVAAEDRLALRGFVVLLLIVSGTISWGDWGRRIERAFMPEFAAAAVGPGLAIDIFLDPPAYTRLPPIYLSADGVAAEPVEGGPQPATIDVPVGSIVTARVSGIDEAPTLDAGQDAVAFEAMGSSGAISGFEAEGMISAGDSLAVVADGRTLARWPIRVVPDLAPEIVFDEPPAATERQAIRIGWIGRDDYGIAGVTATMALAEEAPQALRRWPAIELELSVPGRQPAEAKGVTFRDLTPHPWAGQTVTIDLAARDAAGNVGRSELVTIELPEKQFTHPVARAIVEQRRALMEDPDDAQIVAETLADLAARPALYGDDIVVFLSLRTAARRLAYARDVEEHVDAVQSQLWDTALRIEDGDLSLAERALRDAQQALMEALDRGASEDEIAQLTEELRQALDRYLDALTRQMQERLARGEQPQMMDMPPGAQMLDRQDLQDMLDRMQELSRQGANDEARDLLSQLQQMLESLENGMMAMQGQQQMDQAMQMLEDLQRLSEAQRQLMDETYRRSQRGEGQERPGDQSQPGQQGERGQQGQGQFGQGQGSGSPMEGRDVQEALRRALGELMREMGEMTGDIPRPFGNAEQAMRRAEGALGRADPGGAVPEQGEALEQLQQGMQGLADQIMEQMARQQGQGTGPMRQRSFQGQDPLGRPLPNQGGADTGTVEIPSEMEQRRVREIQDELRRRLGEPDRTQEERDYLERLLRQF